MRAFLGEDFAVSILLRYSWHLQGIYLLSEDGYLVFCLHRSATANGPSSDSERRFDNRCRDISLPSNVNIRALMCSIRSVILRDHRNWHVHTVCLAYGIQWIIYPSGSCRSKAFVAPGHGGVGNDPPFQRWPVLPPSMQSACLASRQN